MTLNTHNHTFGITKNDRENLHGHKAYLIWFTGISGSGKSTLANLVEIALHKKRLSTYLLDGDNIRQGINKNLGFSADDRKENIRRVGEIANLILNAGVITLASFISPYTKGREEVKKIVGADNFIEIFVNCSLEVCETRDVKGLYKKARSGEIKDFSGLSAPYQVPINPDIEVKTDNQTLEESVDQILNYLKQKTNIFND